MKTAGYGMDRPIAENSTAAGRSQNRRVEIVIAEGEIEEET
jgi:outer membrane protein OmpA-like peptidoglycan-associated protein